jgi:hypothetical protein
VDDDEREAERQRFIADACLGEGSPAGRLGLYRRLIQGNLATVARRLLPRTADALDALAPGTFSASVARFLAEQGPSSAYLRDVPRELVAWALPAWERDHPVIADLARYEVARFDIESAPRPPSVALAEVAPERALVFAAPRMLARYAHAVHGDSVGARDTHLFIHRDADNELHVTEVDPLRARLLARLLSGVPLGEAVASEGMRDPRELAEWLASLGESGALLGGAG